MLSGVSEADGASSSKAAAPNLARTKSHSKQMGEEPQKPAVRRLDLEYDRVKELEDRVEVRPVFQLMRTFWQVLFYGVSRLSIL